jgi:selenide,water dikinase
MKIDFAKRREVMERSQRLGHCICDPRRPCPCEVFVNQRICPCAGERPEPKAASTVKLTQLAHNAGCASKIAPADLDAVLARLPAVRDPNVISGLAAADDAAIYRIADGVCLVQTVDVFTPCVDDARLFGRICAANCLSDIYATGGDPKTALSVLAFPSETLSGDIMGDMLTGAMETLAEAGVALVGGHSIKDEEIKLGFAVTGVIDPAVAAGLEKARPGDVLILTKPLGTGVLSFSQQIGRGNPVGLEEAGRSMAALNRDASVAMRRAGASACTDVTGFGLFGHLTRLARQGGLAAEVFIDNLPAFTGAVEALREGVIPGAVERNREYVGSRLLIEPGADAARVNLGFDAQTSGGLLIAMVPERVGILLEALAKVNVTAQVIGRMVTGNAGEIRVLTGEGNVAGAAAVAPSPVSSVEAGHEPGCCAEVFAAAAATAAPAPTPGGSAAEAQRAFGALMRSVQAGGAVDEVTKELVLFGMVLQSRCGPCFEAHYAKALKMGITQAQLDEIAWCAIAMGGAPVRMFYQECLAKVQR